MKTISFRGSENSFLCAIFSIRHFQLSPHPVPHKTFTSFSEFWIRHNEITATKSIVSKVIRDKIFPTKTGLTRLLVVASPQATTTSKSYQCNAFVHFKFAQWITINNIFFGRWSKLTAFNLHRWSWSVGLHVHQWMFTAKLIILVQRNNRSSMIIYLVRNVLPTSTSVITIRCGVDDPFGEVEVVEVTMIVQWNDK